MQENVATNCTDNRLPKIDMTFLSEEEAYSFYNKYAKAIGFSIRRGSHHKVKNTTVIQQRTFTCSRQGMGCLYFVLVILLLLLVSLR